MYTVYKNCVKGVSVYIDFNGNMASKTYTDASEYYE